MRAVVGLGAVGLLSCSTFLNNDGDADPVTDAAPGEMYTAWDRTIPVDVGTRKVVINDDCSIGMLAALEECEIAAVDGEIAGISSLTIPSMVVVRVAEDLVIVAETIDINGVLDASAINRAPANGCETPDASVIHFGGGGGGGAHDGGAGAGPAGTGVNPGGERLDPPTSLTGGCPGGVGATAANEAGGAASGGAGGGALHLIATRRIEIEGEVRANGGPGLGGGTGSSDGGAGGGGGGAGGVIILDSAEIRLVGQAQLRALGGGGGGGATQTNAGIVGEGCSGGLGGAGNHGGSGCDGKPTNGLEGNGVKIGGGGGGGSPGFIFNHNGTPEPGGTSIPPIGPAPAR